MAQNTDQTLFGGNLFDQAVKCLLKNRKEAGFILSKISEKL